MKLNRELTAELLGFGKVQNNAIYVMNSRGAHEFTLLAALANVQLDTSRLASDLIAFSDQQFGYFTIPEPFTTGSSIMPQKRNPDVLELVRGRAASFSGHLSALFALLQGLRSGYSRDLQETKENLVKGLDDSADSLAILAPLIDDLGVDEEALISAFTKEVFATDEVFERVKEGQPFREAYREVKESLFSGEAGQSVEKKRAREAIGLRDHRGGPGDLRLSEAREELEREREKWSSREEEFHRALKELAKMEGSGTDSTFAERGE